MILEGNITVLATQQRVWDALWDLPTLASWIEGVVGVSQIDDQSYRARLQQQVGPVKTDFDMVVTVVETDAPRRIALMVQGQDRKLASNLSLNAHVSLVTDQTFTVLKYWADLTITGRLGALGSTVIQQKAREAEAQFAHRASAALA